jgi:hypothetical protein
VEREVPRQKGRLEKLRGQSRHNPGVGMLTKVMEAETESYSGPHVLEKVGTLFDLCSTESE